MVGRRRTLVAGFLAAFALVAVLLALVGVGDVGAALSTAEPELALATVGLAGCWLLAWSLVLRRVLAALDVRLSVPQSFLTYAGAVFANNVTPFGQAGGEPVAALLVSKVSDARYETGLVAVATVDVVNVVASVGLVLVAVGYRSSTATLGGELRTAVASALTVVAVVATLLAVVWYYRDAVASRLAAGVARLVAWARTGSPDVADLEASVVERIHNSIEHVERLAADRRTLAVVLALSLTGWLLQAAALAVAFAAVGYSLSPAVAVFVVPLGNLAGAAPLPGGLGGIEAAFVGLLVSTTGVAAPAVTAAVLLYRGAIYWLPVLVGAGSMTAFGVRSLA